MAKKLKLSPWHDGSVKPVHVGVYQRKWIDGDVTFSNWTGTHWSWSFLASDDNSLIMAALETPPTYMQSLKWRGVLK